MRHLHLSLAAAALLGALACGKHESKLDNAGSAAGSGSSAIGSGSASAGSADAWSKPAGSAAEAPCNDADIQKHIDDSLAASLAYLGELEKKTATWKQDCEAARKDLLALEPQATKFMDAMKEFVAWARTLGPSCGARVQKLGEQSAAARDIEARTPGIEAKVRPMLELCKDKPGFADAAAKGLRVMHRKKP